MQYSADGAMIMQAYTYAILMHGEQKRKYTGAPYVTHCAEVACIVADAGGTTEMICAALLHDVIEDTDSTIEAVEYGFGAIIAEYVGWLTDVDKPEDGNRAIRKRLDREHIARAPAEAQTIKCADLISNMQSIVAHDPDFAKVYLREKALLLDVLDKADYGLRVHALQMVEDGFAKLEMMK